MLGILKKVFGDVNQRHLNRFKKLLNKLKRLSRMFKSFQMISFEQKQRSLKLAIKMVNHWMIFYRKLSQ